MPRKAITHTFLISEFCLRHFMSVLFRLLLDKWECVHMKEVSAANTTIAHIRLVIQSCNLWSFQSETLCLLMLSVFFSNRTVLLIKLLLLMFVA